MNPALFAVDSLIFGIIKEGNTTQLYPKAVATALDLPLGDVFLRMTRLAQLLNWMELKYEVRCDACQHIHEVCSCTDPTSLYRTDFSCDKCGHKGEVTANSIFPVFHIPGIEKEQGNEATSAV